MKPNPICITKQKFKFENEGEKEIEKKGIDEIPYTNLCCIILLCLMLLSLPVPLFFILSLSLLCVCTCSLFVSLPSFSFFFFFFCTCPLQFIEELRSSFPLLLLLPDQFMEQSKLVFLPQFLTSWSATPHYFHFSSSWQVTPLLLRCGAL